MSPRISRRTLIIVSILSATLAAVALLRPSERSETPPSGAMPAPAREALTVSTVQARREQLPRRIVANGNIAAWQEASIGTESNGLRVVEVHANVGDRVRKGQLLARFADDTLAAELAEARAAVAEAEATLAEASANAERARKMQNQGFFSAQTINQYFTAENTARARLDAQRAALQAKTLRLEQTRVLAPDDGIVSARSATVGAVLPAGQELFRLIRGGRLEWRAEVAAADMQLLKPGMRATISLGGASPLQGRLRMVGPTVDAQTRNGVVYVDLPASPLARAGMYAHGEFELAAAAALTLPQTAVVLREGFSYVMRLDEGAKVAQVKVGVGRRAGDRVEIASGLSPTDRVVATGAAFLSDGDRVRVVEGGDTPAAARALPNPAALR
jgi:HlyD family secretion protein